VSAVPEYEELVAPPHPVKPASRIAVWTALAVVYVVWGSTFVGVRVTIESMPPQMTAGLRCVAAVPFVALLVVWRRGWRALLVSPRELGSAAVVGTLLLGICNSSVALGVRFVPSGVAALILASIPVFVVMLRAASGDRPGWITWLGVAVGLGGVVWLMLPGAHITGLDGVSVHQRVIWSVVMLVGSLAWAVGTWLSPRLTTPADPMVGSTYQLLIGGSLILVAGFVRGERASALLDVTPRSWVAFAYLVLAGSVLAFSAYVWLVDHAPISLVSTYAYVNPVVAVALASLIVGEPITSGLLVGGAVVVVGVALVVGGERRAAPAPVDAEGTSPT